MFQNPCLVVFTLGFRTEEHAAQVEPALAVVKVKLVKHIPAIVITGEETVVESETFALRLLGIDAHHGFHRRIITCTGIAYHLYTLYVIR